MSWTHPQCNSCWYAKYTVVTEDGFYQTRQPVRLTDPDEENCCWCGEPTRSGIYVREDRRALSNCKGHAD